MNYCFIDEMICLEKIFNNTFSVDLGYVVESTIVDNYLLALLSSGYIFNFNLLTNSTSLTSLESFNLSKNSRVLSYKNFFFIFGGFVNNTLDNTLTLYNASLESKIYPKILSKYQLFPQTRTRSALIAVRNKIYLFGGLCNNQILNDFWVYDPLLEKWSLALSNNEPPSPRHSFSYASIGDILVIWGGITKNGYSGELFIYNVVTKLWNEMNVYSNLRPSKRFGACLVIDLPLLYIGGGADELGLCNDLWIFDITTGIYKKTNFHIKKVYSYCYKDKEHIVEVLGETQIPDLNSVYGRLSFINSDWGSIAQKFSKGLAVISGSTNLGDISNTVHYSFGKSQLIGISSDYICNSMYTFYNSSIYYFAGSYYTSHFKAFHSLPRAKFARFEFDKICKQYKCTFECSKGFIPYNFSCKICPAGYYSDNEACTPCLKGHFNPIPGASSSKQCYPCPEGTFSDKQGSRMCKLCKNGYYCYAGSSSPEIIKAKKKEDINSQTKLYDSEYIKRLEIIVYPSGITLILIIAIVFLLSSKIKKIITRWDLYSNYHNYKELDRILNNKNSIGGIFTVIFFISFTCISTAVICNYFFNNNHEEQSLIPLVLFNTIIKRFSANFQIVVSIKNYADFCVAENQANNIFLSSNNFSSCASNILLSFVNINKQKVSTQCKLTIDRFCLIKIPCSGCEVETNSIINLFLQGNFSYGASISVNLTSESSIPNKYSTVHTEIFPKKKNIFLGPSPSIFTYILVPSLFISSTQSHSLIQTGYHVQELSSPIKGSEKVVEDFFLPSQLGIKIVLEKNSLGLLTEIKQERSFFSLFGTLFGTFTGFLGIFGFFMRRAESIHLLNKSEKFTRSSKSVILMRQHYANIFKDIHIKKLNENWIKNTVVQKKEIKVEYDRIN